MVRKWRDIVGYEGLYKVSNDGQILNVKRNRLLKQCNKGILVYTREIYHNTAEVKEKQQEVIIGS